MVVSYDWRGLVVLGVVGSGGFVWVGRRLLVMLISIICFFGLELFFGWFFSVCLYFLFRGSFFYL